MSVEMPETLADDEVELVDDVDNEPERGFWWMVPRNAQILGSLQGLTEKGRVRRGAKRSISFDWVFEPSETNPSNRSPYFEWLGMTWSIRFQKSPYFSSTMHRSSWSLFLDLFPPYEKIFHITGKIWLRHGDTPALLWKVNSTFEPAWEEQELCTWSRRGLNLQNYVDRMKGHDLTLRVQLSTVGLGNGYSKVLDMYNDIEELNHTLKVGTTTFQTRFGWNFRKHIQNLSQDQINFWRSLKADRKATKKIDFGPQDLVRVVEQYEFDGICTWRVCRELKSFVVDAIHESKTLIAPIPYHLIFLDFDLMDGSGNDDDPNKEFYYLRRAATNKYQLLITWLDWIVQKPLISAFEKANNSANEESFKSFKQMEKEKKAMFTAGVCATCAKSAAKGKMLLCSGCQSKHYCGKSCQRKDWKKHKIECAKLNERRIAEKKIEKVKQKSKEEKLAYAFMKDMD